jgi:hypothetical protein
MMSFKQFVSHKANEVKKKPLDYNAVRKASAQSKPLQKPGTPSMIVHREHNEDVESTK